jgi:hypothetical protein
VTAPIWLEIEIEIGMKIEIEIEIERDEDMYVLTCWSREKVSRSKNKVRSQLRYMRHSLRPKYLSF